MREISEALMICPGNVFFLRRTTAAWTLSEPGTTVLFRTGRISSWFATEDARIQAAEPGEFQGSKKVEAMYHISYIIYHHKSYNTYQHVQCYSIYIIYHVYKYMYVYINYK